MGNHPVHCKWVVIQLKGSITGNYGLVYPVKETK
jgi:hypothetical protein